MVIFSLVVYITLLTFLVSLHGVVFNTVKRETQLRKQSAPDGKK